jgi:hypothetical protein
MLCACIKALLHQSMTTMTRVRSYSELRRLETFDDRFDYLNLNGLVGETTFGSMRWLNQQFYTSRQWRHVRDAVILRDEGCDLGVPGFEIATDLLIHHMNPVTREDLVHSEPWLIDPEYLITTTRRTHNAIHFGDRSLLPRLDVDRQPGDTKLW